MRNTHLSDRHSFHLWTGRVNQNVYPVSVCSVLIVIVGPRFIANEYHVSFNVISWEALGPGGER